jgi:hypothetical protein
VLLDEFWSDCWLRNRHLADHRQITVANPQYRSITQIGIFH